MGSLVNCILGTLNSRSVWAMLSDTWCDIGVSCTGPGVGPDNPCWSFPTQHIILYYSMISIVQIMVKRELLTAEWTESLSNLLLGSCCEPDRCLKNTRSIWKCLDNFWSFLTYFCILIHKFFTSLKKTMGSIVWSKYVLRLKCEHLMIFHFVFIYMRLFLNIFSFYLHRCLFQEQFLKNWSISFFSYLWKCLNSISTALVSPVKKRSSVINILRL